MTAAQPGSCYTGRWDGAVTNSLVFLDTETTGLAAAPLPQPDTFTSAALGHPIRYPLRVGAVWRSVCSCHWWVALDPDEAEAARR